MNTSEHFLYPGHPHSSDIMRIRKNETLPETNVTYWYVSLLPWGNQYQGVLYSSGRPTSPTYIHDYLKSTKDIWHSFSKNIKVDCLGSEISADPPETPYGQKFLSWRPTMTLKVRVNFTQSYIKNQIELKKHAHVFQKTF